MGLLIDGIWHDQWYDTKSSGGHFIRQEAQFRHWITPDGAAGPSGAAGFKAESNRYHLYVSYACPWAHRTLIYRKLKGLEEIIPVSFVHWYMADKGWTFDKSPDGLVGDNLYQSNFVHELYTKADPSYSGRVTVPILWDKTQETIVSNESSEIIRMFNSAFDSQGATPGDYYPRELQQDIEALNERIYHEFNNGVYKAGFATSQEAYDNAVKSVFSCLEWLESKLEGQRFLLGNNPCEADWRLFPTLLRFDPIYVGHFKCNHKRLVDYQNLWAYTRDLYQWPGIKETLYLPHAVKHYYESHKTINPYGIVPITPEIDWDQPHKRDNL